MSLELGDATGIRIDKLLSILKPLGLSLTIGTQDGADAHAPGKDNGRTLQADDGERPAEGGSADNYAAAFAKATDHIYPSPSLYPSPLLFPQAGSRNER